MQEVKRVEAYSLMEFCQKVQEAVQEGYVFDFESNENFPQKFGSFMGAGMVKEAEEVKQPEVEQIQEEQEQEVKQPEVQKRGKKG